MYHGILQKQTFTQADPLSAHKSFVFFGTLLMETFKEKRKNRAAILEKQSFIQPTAVCSLVVCYQS